MDLSFSTLIGNTGVRAQLARSHAADTLRSSYLFYGREGIGKFSTAQCFAQLVFCEAVVGSNACGACPSCVQVAEESHPDLFILRPEGKVIKIAEIRELISFLAVRPFSAPRRLCIVDDADKMNEQSQNCLLKTLEEPYPGAIIILVTSQLQQMLPTIKSRCQKLRFLPPTRDEFCNYFSARGATPEQAAILYDAGAGSIREALQLQEDTAFFSLRNQLFERMGSVDNPFDHGRWFAEQKDSLHIIMPMLRSYYRDVMLLQHGIGAISNGDQRELLQQTAERMDSEQLAKAFTGLFDLEGRLKTNASVQLSFEQYYFQLFA